MVKAMTGNEFQAALNDPAPVNYDEDLQLDPAGTPSRLERLVIRLGESGGVLVRNSSSQNFE
jgi:hypothetical protein